LSTTLVSRSERPPAAAGAGARRLTERAFRIRESGIIVVLIVFVAVTARPSSTGSSTPRTSSSS
jgi:hypothetical protein